MEPLDFILILAEHIKVCNDCKEKLHDILTCVAEDLDFNLNPKEEEN